MSEPELRSAREWDTHQFQLQVHVGRDRPQGGRWSAAMGYPPRRTEAEAWADYDAFIQFWAGRTVEHNQFYPCDARDFIRVVEVYLHCTETLTVCRRNGTGQAAHSIKRNEQDNPDEGNDSQ